MKLLLDQRSLARLECAGAAALVLLAAGCGGAEPSREPAFELFLRTHEAPERAFEGVWVQPEPPHLTLYLREGAGDHVHVAALADDVCAWTVSRGQRAGATLRLDGPVYGLERLTLCRLEDRDVLLPDGRCWIDAGPPPIPRGLVFLRDPSLTLDAAHGSLPGPDESRQVAPAREERF